MLPHNHRILLCSYVTPHMSYLTFVRLRLTSERIHLFIMHLPVLTTQTPRGAAGSGLPWHLHGPTWIGVPVATAREVIFLAGRYFSVGTIHTKTSRLISVHYVDRPAGK
jgi:hypothetical protein